MPKKAIYEKFQMNTAAKERFDADVSRLTLVNEVSPQRVNLAAGETVKSFYVLQVSLKSAKYNENNIAMLSKLIPQKILFVPEFEGKARIAVFETRLLQSAWTPTDSLSVPLVGLDLDAVWTNIVKSVALNGAEPDSWNNEISLTENLILIEKRKKLRKEIEKLEKLARAEKQPKKKFELVQRIKTIEQKVEEINS